MGGDEDHMSVRSRLLVVAGGQILPVINKLALDIHDVHAISRELQEAVYWRDLLFLILFGWGMVPFCSILFYVVRDYFSYPFEKSYTFQIASHISQATRLALVIYFADCLVVALVAIGFDFDRLSNLSKGFAKILYIAWIAQRVTVFKRYLFGKAVSRAPNKLGRLEMVDRLADIVLYIVTGFILLDILNVQMGVGLTSVFAFGSAGTLIVGLASKDVATMFVNGFLLTTSGRMSEGDVVQFGDGTTGIIQKVGWFQTILRNFDDISETIPNSQLGMMRVKNVSRATKCQVKQTLRFQYEDIEKIPKILEDILTEIKEAIPEAITDGSSPFRAVWTNYQDYYLEAELNTHYNLPATGQPYYENRQRVMKAIHRAVKFHGVEFAKPPVYLPVKSIQA